MRAILLFLIYFQYGECRLWPKGVVHYAINKKDYDIHSQDEIMTTLSQLHNEICVKFFYTPLNYTATVDEKILFISNPDKRKTCPPDIYNYSGSVVDMPIGYKCINPKDIARIVMSMLRASIEQTVSTINSYDLIKKFQERNDNPTRSTLLSPEDRNYINAHYNSECGALSQRPTPQLRRTGDDYASDSVQLTESNLMYYEDKLWPLAIVMYGVEEKLRGTQHHQILKYAMTSIELSTCVVFQDIGSGDAVLTPKNFLWFGSDGEEATQLGFREGNQTVKLESAVVGAPGHTAHGINMLMRALGVPMMSNRHDRDNYVIINWKNVEKGKEHYLERVSPAAWLQQIPYDLDSVTHAPANFMCGNCALGAQTVQPIQDHLWQRTLSMGHKTVLSESDVLLLNILYGKQCQNRFVSHN